MGALYTQAVRATNGGTGEVIAASADGLTGRGAVGIIRVLAE
jgi:hypothetical protein